MKKLYLITTKTKAIMKSTEETIHSIGRAKFRELTVKEIENLLKKYGVDEEFNVVILANAICGGGK